VALGIGGLRRRGRGQRVQSPRTLGRLAMVLVCLGSLLSGEAFGEAPTARTPSPGEPAQESRSLGFMIGLRGEAELLKGGFTPSLTAELSGGSDARLPDVRLGAALTALFRPMGVRAEGRLYPYDLGIPGKWRVRPYLALGATYFLSSGGWADGVAWALPSNSDRSNSSPMLPTRDSSPLATPTITSPMPCCSRWASDGAPSAGEVPLHVPGQAHLPSEPEDGTSSTGHYEPFQASTPTCRGTP